MIELDPKKLFRRLAGEIPKPLHPHILIVGSLAAAYHYRIQLKTRAVNTKDADLIVRPAGDVGSCKKVAETLLKQGWTRTDKCFPMPRPKPAKDLRAIRLNPPKTRDYFVEILGLPRTTQKRPVVWAPVQLDDGWYGIGCFRFMAVISLGKLRSTEGLHYASPSAMALANLLAHPRLGEQKMSDLIGDREILRSAKDLGRVLALAWLEGREGTAEWVADWRRRLKGCFPSKWRTLAKGLGRGLRALLANPIVLEEARITTEVGLLNRLDVSSEMLRGTGERLLVDAISLLEAP